MVFRLAVFRLAILVSLCTQFGGGQPAQLMNEYHVKAAFLYNFAKFIDWPADTYQDAADPFAICVLGQYPFDRTLDDLVAGKTIAGRPFAIRRVSDVRQTAGCQILFVSSSVPKHVCTAIAAAKQEGVLTVGEASNAGADDMVITLNLQDGKVRFEINLRKANEEKLHISARLLSLATVVKK
jgi:hypothetical protein